MNTIQRIIKNTAALFLAQFIIMILSLVLSIFIARKLGDVNFGKYSFAIAFTALFTIFSDLGYNTLLIREVARDKSQASKYLNNIISIRILSSLILMASIIIIINIMGYPNDSKNIVYLFGISSLLTSFSDVFKLIFRAFEDMEYEAGIKISANIIRVFFGLVVLLLGYGLIELGIIYIISSIFECLLGFLVYKQKYAKPKVELDLDFLKSTIWVALPLSMASIFGLIYVRIDTVMLSMMKGDAVVGWYDVAYNLVLVFKPLPSLFLNAIFPLMSFYYISSIDLLKLAYEKAAKFLIILGLPLAMGIAFLADRIIPTLYGEQFYPSIIALQILAWDVLLIFLYGPLGNVLVSINKQKVMAAVAGFSALLNIALNLTLIPHLSYVGAAIATLITETILFIIYLYLVSKHLRTFFLHKLIMKPLIASLFMGFFIYFCPSMNLFLIIAISIILYFIVLCIIGGFSDSDKELVKKLFM